MMWSPLWSGILICGGKKSKLNRMRQKSEEKVQRRDKNALWRQ